MGASSSRDEDRARDRLSPRRSVTNGQSLLPTTARHRRESPNQLPSPNSVRNAGAHTHTSAHVLITYDVGVYYGGVTNDGQTRHGHGTMSFANGDRYIGAWVDDKMHGRGHLMWRGGSRYVGEFHANALEGVGRYSFADRSFFEGTFRAGHMVGIGVFCDPHGQHVALDLAAPVHPRRFAASRERAVDMESLPLWLKLRQSRWSPAAPAALHEPNRRTSGQDLPGDRRHMGRPLHATSPTPTRTPRRTTAAAAQQSKKKSEPQLGSVGKQATSCPEGEEPCVVCLQYRRSYACVPCGHMCLCRNCANDARVKRCPVCRASVKFTMKIFS